MRTSSINLSILEPARSFLSDTQLISVDIFAESPGLKKFNYSEKFDTSHHSLEEQEFAKLQGCFKRAIFVANHLGLKRLGQWTVKVLYGDLTGQERRVTLTHQGVMLDLTYLTPADHEANLEV